MNYEEFVNHIETTYPKMFSEKYGGICVGDGWFPIIDSLCRVIQNHIDFTNSRRADMIKNDQESADIPDEVPQVVVSQIKEKFGGLRFYYSGGDSVIFGLVQMAECWAYHTCEVCGNAGKPQRVRGWIQTLCRKHVETNNLEMEDDETL